MRLVPVTRVRSLTRVRGKPLLKGAQAGLKAGGANAPAAGGAAPAAAATTVMLIWLLKRPRWAVMTDNPAATALTRPVGVMVTAAGLELDQSTCCVQSGPGAGTPLSATLATSCRD